MNRIFFFLLVIIPMVIGGCAVKQPLPRGEYESKNFRIGEIVHMPSGEALSFDRFMVQLGTSPLVFIGEVHDNPEHHLVQVQILQGLRARYGPFNVAMEFFQEPQQEAVDKYMAGTITEEVFLEEADWDSNWGFPYYFYRSLMLMVRDMGTKLLAINAPRHVVKKVGRSGLDGLTPEERGLLAEVIDLENQEHRAFVKEAYEAHPHDKIKRFDLFYQAQCVWEDTMAENIAEFMAQNPGRLVVFIGNGHIFN